MKKIKDKSGKYFLSTHNNKIVLDIPFDDIIINYNSNIIFVEVDKKYGVVNKKTGKYTHEAKYDSIRLDSAHSDYAMVSNGNNYGIIHVSGVVILDTLYSSSLYVYKDYNENKFYTNYYVIENNERKTIKYNWDYIPVDFTMSNKSNSIEELPIINKIID